MTAIDGRAPTALRPRSIRPIAPSAGFSPPEMIPLSWMPCDGGKPLEVIAMCIPFLLVEKVDGTRETLDMRQCRIARISPEFAEKVRKAHHKNLRRRLNRA